MDERRDKVHPPDSTPNAEPTEPAEETEKPAMSIPEEADEIIEIVDDDPGAVSPATAQESRPQPGKPSLPEEEALQQIRTLKAQLERKDSQIEQVMEAYRSKKAETQKLRERIEKTERRRFEQSKGDFIARFVEVLDNLDRAIDSIENSFDQDSVLQGIMLVRSRLVQLLKTEGLEKIFVRGQPFDPLHSEAAEMESVSEEDHDGIVIRELQPGYMLKGALLRAARVVVGRFGDEPESEAEKAKKTPTVSGETPEEKDWEADASGHELEFSEDGLDFSGE